MAAFDSLMTPDLARELWTYDPETGELRWRVKRSNMKPGQLAGSDVRRYSQVGVRLAGRTRLLMVHRIIWLMMTGAWPMGDVDHIDGDTRNNRWANLRDVSTSTNCQNQRRAQRNSAHGYLGVTYSKQHGKWRARITVDGKKRHLGLFDRPEEAHACYVEAKRLFHEGCTI